MRARVAGSLPCRKERHIQKGAQTRSLQLLGHLPSRLVMAIRVRASEELPSPRPAPHLRQGRQRFCLTACCMLSGTVEVLSEMDLNISLCTLHCLQPVLHNSVFRSILSLLAATLIYCGHPALQGGHEFGQFVPKSPCSLALRLSCEM